jgi:hypothetical protein
MSEKIPSFWSREAVKPRIITPLAFLRVQASKLGEETRGLLLGEITTTMSESKRKNVEHHLDIIAPALDNQRLRIVVARQSSQIYRK